MARKYDGGELKGVVWSMGVCMYWLNGSSSNGVMCTEESTVATLKLLIPPWRGGRACVWPLVLGASRMSHYNINLLKGGN